MTSFHLKNHCTSFSFSFRVVAEQNMDGKNKFSYRHYQVDRFDLLTILLRQFVLMDMYISLFVKYVRVKYSIVHSALM